MMATVYHNGELNEGKIRRTYLENHYCAGKMSIDDLWVSLLISNGQVKRIVKSARRKNGTVSLYDVFRAEMNTDMKKLIPCIIVPPVCRHNGTGRQLLPNPPPPP
jgi:hypothetical protein